MTAVVHLIISGRVQGVGFRYSMAAQARLLGVCGWVRNRRDGSVEAMIAGDPDQIDRMLAWCRVGPAGSAVEKVAHQAASGEFAGFEIETTV